MWSSGPNTDQPKKKPGLILIARLISLTSAAGLQFVAARSLGLSEYGVFAFANLTAIFILTVLASAIPQGLRREVARCPEMLPVARVILRSWHVPIAAGCALIAAIIPLALQPGTTVFLCVALGAEVFCRAGLLQPEIALLNGLGKLKNQATVIVVHSLFRGALSLILVASGFGASGAVLGLFVGTVVATRIAVMFTQRQPAVSLDDSGSAAIRLRRFLRFNPLYMFAVATCATVSVWTLSTLQPSEASLASMSAVFLLFRNALPIGQAVASGNFSEIARNLSINDVNAARTILVRSVQLFALMGLPGAVFLFFAGLPVLKFIYGPEFNLSGISLASIFVGMWSLGLIAMTGDYLEANGRFQRRLVVILSAALAIFILTPPSWHWFAEAGVGLCFCGVMGCAFILVWLEVTCVGRILPHDVD